MTPSPKPPADLPREDAPTVAQCYAQARWYLARVREDLRVAASQEEPRMRCSSLFVVTHWLVEAAKWRDLARAARKHQEQE